MGIYLRWRNKGFVSRFRPGAVFVKSTISELLFGNDNVDIETRILNGNSSVVEHVHSINYVANGRTSHGFVESNIGDTDINDWLTLPHIIGGLGSYDEMGKQRPGVNWLLY